MENRTIIDVPLEGSENGAVTRVLLTTTENGEPIAKTHDQANDATLYLYVLDPNDAISETPIALSELPADGLAHQFVSFTLCDLASRHARDENVQLADVDVLGPGRVRCVHNVAAHDAEETRVVNERLARGGFEKARRIGIACSGGGTRAAFGTRTFFSLLDADATKPLNRISHVTGLSGSTWFLSQLLQAGTFDTVSNLDGSNSLDQFDSTDPSTGTGVSSSMKVLFNGFRHYMAGGLQEFLHLKEKEDSVFYTDKYFMENYTNMLGLMYFKEAWTLRNARALKIYRYSNCKQHLGKFPFPLFTAMGTFETDQKNPEVNEEWYEFSPISVQACRAREEDPLVNNSVETAYFGGAIDELGVMSGKSVSEEMAQMMALYGSAFSATTRGILKEAIPRFAPYMEADESADKWPILVTPFAMNSWVQGRTAGKIRLRDAGLRCNLPIQPLLVKFRNISNIILFDASENTQEFPGQAILLHLKWAEANDKEATCVKKFHPEMIGKIKAMYPDPPLSKEKNHEQMKPQLFEVALSEDQIDSYISKLLYVPLINNIEYDRDQKDEARWFTSNFSAPLEIKEKCRDDVTKQYNYCKQEGFFSRLGLM